MRASNIFLVLTLPLVLMASVSCSKTGGTPAVSIIGSYVEAASRSASISIEINVPEGIKALNCGVYVSEKEAPASDSDAVVRQVKVSKESRYQFNVTDLQPTKGYHYQPFVQLYDLTFVYGETKAFTTLAAKNLDGHEYVNLGLKSNIKWAAFNMESSDGTGLLPWSGLPDAIKQNWSESWQLPSQSDWEELMNDCFWSWDVQNGMQGMLVRGPNGNTLFLPAAGYMAQGKISSFNDYGAYWTCDAAPANPGCSWSLFFGMDFVYWNPFYQVCSASVRPVTKVTIYDYD